MKELSSSAARVPVHLSTQSNIAEECSATSLWETEISLFVKLCRLSVPNLYLKLQSRVQLTRWRHWRCCVVCCVGFKRGGGWRWLSPGETSTRQHQLFPSPILLIAFSPFLSHLTAFFFLVDTKCVSDPCWAELYNVVKRSKSKDLCIQSRNLILRVFHSVEWETKYVGLNRRCCQVTGT